MEFILTFLLFLLAVYYLLPIVLRRVMPFLLRYMAKEMTKRAMGGGTAHQNTSRSHRNATSSRPSSGYRPGGHEKIFKKDEGEYIDFEEVK